MAPRAEGSDLDDSILTLVRACGDPGETSEMICMSIVGAFALRAPPGRRVTVEVKAPTDLQGAQFDLEDVCMAGRRSASGECWCVPREKVLNWR